MQRPNPLVDELTDDAKAELAAMFADMKKRCDAPVQAVKPWPRRHQIWERGGW